MLITYSRFKGFCDRFVALLSIILLLPIFIVVPADSLHDWKKHLISQSRSGYRGRPFQFLNLGL